MVEQKKFNFAEIFGADKIDENMKNNLDRQKDGVLSKQIINDMVKLAFNLSRPEPDGTRLGNYNSVIMSLSPKPKSSQSRQASYYKKLLEAELERKKTDFSKLKDYKKLLVYIIVYLRKERYEQHDIDNFPKGIIDSLKPYIGDDKNIVCLIAEKRMLQTRQKEDYDFFEQVVILITDISAKVDVLKE